MRLHWRPCVSAGVLEDGHHSGDPRENWARVRPFACVRGRTDDLRELKSRGIDAKKPFVGNALWVSVTDRTVRALLRESDRRTEETVFSEGQHDR